VSKSVANFVHALIAVLAGNAAYFWVVRYLPARAQHVPLHLDLGMVIDFWFCLVAFGIAKFVASRKSS
jgi:hypothetical protein